MSMHLSQGLDRNVVEDGLAAKRLVCKNMFGWSLVGLARTVKFRYERDLEVFMNGEIAAIERGAFIFLSPKFRVSSLHLNSSALTLQMFVIVSVA